MNRPEHTKAGIARNIAIARRMQKIGRLIERELEKAAGKDVPDLHFALLIFHDHRTQYCSNAERESIKEAMKELLGRWDNPSEELGIPRFELPGFEKDQNKG